MATTLAYLGVANPTAHWSTPYSTGGTIISSPAIASDGTVYIGSNDNKLYAIHPDGSAKWTFMTGDWVDSTPAIGADGTVYFGSWDNQLYAVNPTNGSKLWDFNTSSSIIASPAIGVDGRIYFGSKDEFFYALESNGSLAWQTYVGNAITSSAAIGQDGTIYFGDENGTFHALNQDGTTKWTYEVDDVTDTNKSILSSPAIDLSGNLYFGSGNGYCYSIADGVSAAILNWKVGTNDRVDASPVLGQNNEVFFVSRDGYLRSVDTVTGITNWEVFAGDVFYSSPVVDANGRVYVIGYTGFGENHLFAYNNDGSKAWDTNNSSSPLNIGGLVDSSLALDSNGNLFFGCFDHNVYSVNVGSGIANNAWPQFQRNKKRTGAWPSYMVNVAIFPSSSAGQITGEGIYNQGAAASLSVNSSVNDGYSFDFWSGSHSGIENPLNILVNSNIYLTANFRLNNYTLTVSAGSGGAVIGSGDFPHGSLASISASPISGYSFNKWLGTGITDIFSSSTTVEMNQDRNLTAQFDLLQYTITSVAETGGTVNDINGTYPSQHVISPIIAIPETGYTFSNWIQSGTGIYDINSSTTSLLVDENQSISAIFSPINYDLNLSANTGGSVSFSGSANSYPYGSVVTISANPDSGYYFKNWSGNGIEDINSSTTRITISENHSVQANFAINAGENLILSLNSNPIFAAANFIGDGIKSENEIVQISTVPNAGFTFLNWSGGTVEDINSTSTRTTMVQDLNLTANFALIQHSLIINSGIGGAVSNVNPTQTYGNTVELNAIPEIGYTFDKWQGNTSFTNRYSPTSFINIVKDTSISANFKALHFSVNVFSQGSGITTGGGIFNYGETITLTPQPENGHYFSKWSGARIEDSTSPALTILVIQDLNITATFLASSIALNSALNASKFTENWYGNNWFGFFFQTDENWCYHFNLGWIYPEELKDGSFWVWSPQLKWIWIEESTFSNFFIWSDAEANWFYTDFTSNFAPRIFRYSVEKWIVFDKTKITNQTNELF